MALKSPLEDTIWGAQYGSVASVREAFDRSGHRYHDAIMRSGVPGRAAAQLAPHLAEKMRGIDFGCGGGAMGIALREAASPDCWMASIFRRACWNWRGRRVAMRTWRASIF